MYAFIASWYQTARNKRIRLRLTTLAAHWQKLKKNLSWSVLGINKYVHESLFFKSYRNLFTIKMYTLKFFEMLI